MTIRFPQILSCLGALALLAACAQPSARTEAARVVPGDGSEDVSMAQAGGDGEQALQEVDLLVKGMTWPSSCVRRVRAALRQVPGVTDVQIDFNRRIARVQMDAERFDAGALLAALNRAGYAAKVLPPGKPSA